jgi:hypothetical protein
VSAQRARNGPSVTTASATGGSRPGQLLRDLDASAELARRERFATVPITRTNSTARSHSRLAASTLRPLRWRRSDARRPPGRDFSFQPRVLRRVCLGPRPASGCGGFGSSRGGSAVPTSPSAGVGAGPDGDRSLKHHFPVGSSPARGRAVRRSVSSAGLAAALVVARQPSRQLGGAASVRMVRTGNAAHVAHPRSPCPRSRRRDAAVPGDLERRRSGSARKLSVALRAAASAKGTGGPGGGHPHGGLDVRDGRALLGVDRQDQGRIGDRVAELRLVPGRGLCAAKTGGPLHWSVWGDSVVLQAAVSGYVDR